MIQWKLPLIIFLLISSTCLGLDKVTNKQPKDVDLFPKPPVCGTISESSEFPWLAKLEYRKDNGILEVDCAGSILNQRYVVTAAHCVKDQTERTLESLRVGEHNTKPEDCEGCMEPFQRLRIAEAIVHGNYKLTDQGRIYNNIALLKTDKDIIYSLAVVPICLPAVIPSLKPAEHGTKLTVVGWGHDGTDYTAEKRILDVDYIANNACRVRVELKQICAKGESGEDSCAVQSGGTLARPTPQAWVMEGLVSYGYPCESQKPVIYTRIRSFHEWIRDTVNTSNYRAALGKPLLPVIRIGATTTITSRAKNASRAEIPSQAQEASDAYSNQPVKNISFGFIAILLWLSV